MSALVNFQTAGAGVAFAADVALEGFITSVDQLVCFQMTFSNEFLITVCKGASKWSFTSLNL